MKEPKWLGMHDSRNFSQSRPDDKHARKILKTKDALKLFSKNMVRNDFIIDHFENKALKIMNSVHSRQAPNRPHAI